MKTTITPLTDQQRAAARGGPQLCRRQPAQHSFFITAVSVSASDFEQLRSDALGLFHLAIVFGQRQSRMKVAWAKFVYVKNLVSNLISVRGRTGELQEESRIGSFYQD